MMPLIIAPQNKNLKIARISADEKTKRHLFNLGVIIGSEVVMLSEQSGNVIVKVKDSKLALNRELASKIMVG